MARFRKPQGSFAQALEAAARDAESSGTLPVWARQMALARKHSDEVNALAGNLQDLPVTLDEAREIADRLISLAGDMRNAVAAGVDVDVEKTATAFAHAVGAEFNVADADMTPLVATASRYIRRTLVS